MNLKKQGKDSGWTCDPSQEECWVVCWVEGGLKFFSPKWESHGGAWVARCGHVLTWALPADTRTMQLTNQARLLRPRSGWGSREEIWGCSRPPREGAGMLCSTNNSCLPQVEKKARDSNFLFVPIGIVFMRFHNSSRGCTSQSVETHACNLQPKCCSMLLRSPHRIPFNGCIMFHAGISPAFWSPPL